MPISGDGYKRWLEMNAQPEENEAAKPLLDKVHLQLLEKNQEFKELNLEFVAYS